MKIAITDIVYDLGEEEVDVETLPKEMVLEQEELDVEDLTETLSFLTGFAIEGFHYETLN